jgi:4-alpha-glucanotransferase
MTVSDTQSALRALARLYGIDLTYHDIWENERVASDEALTRVLQALGAPINSPADLGDAHKHRLRTVWSRRLEPVNVAWNGRSAPLVLRIPASLEGSTAECLLETEDGGEYSWQISLSDRPTIDGTVVDGTINLAKQLSGLEHLPLGYHRFKIEVGGRRDESLIISAPERAWSYAADTDNPRRWGVFMPLHALRSHPTRWGGNLSDLERLLTWVGGLGGSLVGTLPLLATFLDEPFDPSPYSPASRLFWNELFLDLDKIAGSSGGSTLLSASRGPLSESSSVRDYVDYRTWSQEQRAVLQAASHSFFQQGGAREPSYREFLARHPRVIDYARFRAIQERQRRGWVVWPEGLRDGHIGPADFDPKREQYHAYVQWLLCQQLDLLAQRSRDVGASLYLDFPLGVHPDSYDTWRERDSFANGIAVGAPPDVFFTGGQNWGFPPQNPDAIRENGYAYFSEALRNHMRYAGALRIDHVMGLMRLFWIPRGMGAQDGIYVRYAADELYAILALESHRATCLVVGEDLGTVPESVREAMAKHDFLRMHVAQFEMSADSGQALRPAPAASMASVNTHDTVLYGGFWEGRDIEIMRLLELISDDEAGERRTERGQLNRALGDFLKHAVERGADKSPISALRAMLLHLAAGPAQVLMVTLEDLWLEREPQNVPGTGDDWQNWRRTARFSFEEFSSNSEVLDALRAVNRARQTGQVTP